MASSDQSDLSSSEETGFNGEYRDYNSTQINKHWTYIQ